MLKSPNEISLETYSIVVSVFETQACSSFLMRYSSVKQIHRVLRSNCIEIGTKVNLNPENLEGYTVAATVCRVFLKLQILFFYLVVINFTTSSNLFFPSAKLHEGYAALSKRSTPVAIPLPYEDSGRVFSRLFSSICCEDGRTSDLQEAGDVHYWTEGGKRILLFSLKFSFVLHIFLLIAAAYSLAESNVR